MEALRAFAAPPKALRTNVVRGSLTGWVVPMVIRIPDELALTSVSLFSDRARKAKVTAVAAPGTTTRTSTAIGLPGRIVAVDNRPPPVPVIVVAARQSSAEA